MTSYVSETAPASHAEMAKEPWLKRVCRIGQGHDCCRYILCGAGGFHCGKHGSLRAHLDDRVARETINARGDNCPGVAGEFAGAP